MKGNLQIPYGKSRGLSPRFSHRRYRRRDDIDGHIEFGGTLKIEDRRFGHPNARREEASFLYDETTRFYIDAAIARGKPGLRDGLERTWGAPVEPAKSELMEIIFAPPWGTDGVRTVNGARPPIHPGAAGSARRRSRP